MALPDIEKLIARAKEIVDVEDHSTMTLTNTYAQLEKENGLKRGSLTREYRARLKTEIEQAALKKKADEADHEDDEEEAEESEESEKEASPARKGTKKRATQHSGSETEDDPESPKKISSTKRKAPQSPSSGSKRKTPSEQSKAAGSKAKQYKSAEFVSSEDEDESEDVPTSSTKVAKSGAAPPAIGSSKSVPAKATTQVAKKRSLSKKSASGPQSRRTKEENPSKLKTKPATKVVEPKETKSLAEDHDGIASDSELSQPSDKPLAKSRSKAKKSTKPQKHGRKSAASVVDKDEVQIKKLKSLVLACGVRKVWVKELKGLDSPSEQVGRLRDILKDLGMTGRLSMEQAKAIKEKRELAQELRMFCFSPPPALSPLIGNVIAEDVQAFDKAVNARSSRSRSAADAKVGKKREREDSEDESEAEVSRARKSARSSIAAFLADQSDDE
ncbi:hypothetical protein K488DRAFT_82290 [Vararia minispora EC-137]|uniref:Uncharacterized protein n=1 Tax=Vararia minispora EC-137 TaxID=1314806 RepID=A0ACB8QX05_9AGAM|nr:hypothetical protein K488DRAFT_82290 [Vararia minispora EC-137]